MRVKNWQRFQHYKSGDRHPDWIKLYRDILDDLEWHKLEPDAAKVLVMLWLIASEDDGNLPDMETLSFRLRMDKSPIETIISKLSHWLEQDASEPLAYGNQRAIEHIAERKQSACLEEEKNKKKKEKGRVFEQPTVDQVKSYCLERNNSVNPEAWHSYYEANGWKVGKNKMVDWKAAVRTWEQRTDNKPVVKPKDRYVRA